MSGRPVTLADLAGDGELLEVLCATFRPDLKVSDFRSTIANLSVTLKAKVLYSKDALMNGWQQWEQFLTGIMIFGIFGVVVSDLTNIAGWIVARIWRGFIGST